MRRVAHLENRKLGARRSCTRSGRRAQRDCPCGLHEILAQIRGQNISVIRSAWAGAAALRATASPGPAKHGVAADYIPPGSSRRHRLGVFDRPRPIFPAANSGAVGPAQRHCGSAQTGARAFRSPEADDRVAENVRTQQFVCHVTRSAEASFIVSPPGRFPMISSFHSFREISETREISPGFSFHDFIVSVDFMKSGPIS
jgi:hypothetical protein